MTARRVLCTEPHPSHGDESCTECHAPIDDWYLHLDDPDGYDDVVCLGCAATAELLTPRRRCLSCRTEQTADNAGVLVATHQGREWWACDQCAARIENGAVW